MKETAYYILKKIEDASFKAYLVGGYPRDYYMNRKSVDIDICTNATPKDLKKIFSDIMLPHVSYGSCTVVKDNIRFEITTFRKEIKYEHNRYPVKMKYINDLLEDLKRRDFTMNTLCMDSNGELIDLLGAKADIDSHLIRMVGDPKIRLKEDALRILRAVRFASTLNFKLEDELKIYIKKYASYLKQLSHTRKKEELDKIFTSPYVSYGISLLKELELDFALGIAGLENVQVTTSPLAIWAQLDCNQYTFTNIEKIQMEHIKEVLKKDLLDPMTLYHYGLYICSLAAEIQGISKKDITEKYQNLPIKSRKEIACSASDLCLWLQKDPGIFLKEVFDELEEKILYGLLKNEKEEIKNYFKDKNMEETYS